VAIPAKSANYVNMVRIVVIDDHELLREGLCLHLAREAGLEVVGGVGSAREARAVIERTHPDLVVLDLELPDKSGIELAAEIKAVWPKIRIVVVTGTRDESAARDAILAGADGFIRKEDASSELLRAIPVVMAGQSYLSPLAATAVTRALRQQAVSAADLKKPQLSERELQGLRGFAEGLTYKEIASSMKVSVRTVETYRARLMRKLGCKNRAELVRHAVGHGLVKL
jgi:DNA-binding NarL/FixJ family response regulator